MIFMVIAKSLLFLTSSEDHSLPKKSGRKTKQQNKQYDNQEQCVTCDKIAKDDAIICQWCGRWEYRGFARISTNEYKMLIASNDRIMFFCTLYYSKVQDQRKVNDRLDAVKAKFTKVLQEVNSALESHKTLVSKSFSGSVSDIATSIVTEQKEKDNLIL